MNRVKRGQQGILSRAYRIAIYTLVLAFWMPQSTAHAQADKPLTIVALGDSLTAGYGLAPQDGFVPQLQAALTKAGHQVTVQNAGVSGDTSSGGLARLDWAVAPGTDGVLLALGANDMLRGIAPEVTRQNLTRIITRLQAQNIKIMLVGMLAAPNLGPAYESQFNAIYPKLAQQYGLVFYPFFLDGVAAERALNLPDGIHPNQQGIARIVARIQPDVERFLKTIAE